MSPRSRAMLRQEVERELWTMDEEKPGSVLPLDLRMRKSSSCRDTEAGERTEHPPTRPQQYSVCQGSSQGIKGCESGSKLLPSISLPTHPPDPAAAPCPGSGMFPEVQHPLSGGLPKEIFCSERSLLNCSLLYDTDGAPQHCPQRYVAGGTPQKCFQPRVTEGAPQNCPQPSFTDGAPQNCPQPHATGGASQNCPQPPVAGAPQNCHLPLVAGDFPCPVEAKLELRQGRERTVCDASLQSQGNLVPRQDSACGILGGFASEQHPRGAQCDNEGPAGLRKPQAPLPLRKRRLTVQDNERSPNSAGKVPKIEECKETACMKGEGPQHGSTEGPVLPSDSCTHPSAYYPPYVTVTFPHLPHYYPGVSGPYLPLNLPLCPVTSYPLLPGPMLGVHRPTLYSLENQLATDITMASKQDEDGDTALHIAVAQGNVNMVQRLIHLFLQGGKELDTYNVMRQTPLHLAVITKQPALVGLLVSHGASPMNLDRNGQTCVHLACEHGSVACLRQLAEICQGNLDLETRNYEGFTPLHVAVNTSNTDAVLFLLEQGADIDAVDIKSGRSPLIHAVENNSMNLVMLLLQNGANVNSQTYSGNTALHSASGRGLLDIVRVLMKNGADCSIKNYHNDTSLMVAKNKKVIDALRGKASRSMSHQNCASKFSVENGSQTLTPLGSSSSSPGLRLTSNDLTGQSPSSTPQRSPMGSFLALPLAPSPRSASSQSGDSRSSQGQRSSPNTNSGKVEQQEPAGNTCSQRTSGTYPPPLSLLTMKAEEKLYSSTAAASANHMICPAVGQSICLPRTPRVFLPVRDAAMDARAASPSCLYPLTAFGSTFLPHQLELPPNHISLVSLTPPQPSFPLPPTAIIHRDATPSTFTTWSSGQRSSNHGLCSKDSEQSEGSSAKGIQEER
ncbi:B-cell lymphoma 3 protein [Rhinatrema bivittatum]|uniref:B-cell lymphoma 3 protein n=1 Tax=Rhinatrema bivittatum TaxID=194408 RepID=UPI00112D0529|nr:B-cell lymphoma 3 protein [Rhinatrema bivittatum]